jgi:hypothetical protein
MRANYQSDLGIANLERHLEAPPGL